MMISLMIKKLVISVLLILGFGIEDIMHVLMYH